MRKIAGRFANNSGASPSQPQDQIAPRGLDKAGPDTGTRFSAQRFLIWEIPTRIVRFCVPTDGDGNMPIEQIAAMLAIHCLALNRQPEDFEVLVAPQYCPPNVTERARQLLAAGCSIGSDVKFTPAERAVLDGVIANLGNKGIASRLNISVRTVKFHVSALLAKFNVQNRVELARRATVSQISRSGLVEIGPGARPASQANLEQDEECLAASHA